MTALKSSLLIFCLIMSTPGFTAGLVRSYLEVSPTNEADLDSLLTAIEETLIEDTPTQPPVVVILHGDEAFSFTRENYLEKKELVDRAAMLAAYDLIDVRMCQTWMNENNVTPSDIPPFIETVPYAPEEIKRLQEQGFLPYDPVRL